MTVEKLEIKKKKRERKKKLIENELSSKIQTF